MSNKPTKLPFGDDKDKAENKLPEIPKNSEDQVDEASNESFPASDPPAVTSKKPRDNN